MSRIFRILILVSCLVATSGGSPTKAFDEPIGGCQPTDPKCKPPIPPLE